MPFIILELLVQFACAYHCITKRKEKRWLWLILFFPVFGSLLYFFIEILPELQRGSPAGYNMLDNVKRQISPGAEAKRLEEDLLLSNTVKNKESLADEYARIGQYQKAIEKYRSCLQGRYEHDTGLLFKLARVYYVAEECEAAIEELHKIQALSDYRPAKVKLLLAQSYQEIGDISKAAQYYKKVVKEHPSMEMKCHYADFLRKQGDLEQANLLLEGILLSAKRMTKQAQKLNTDWIRYAKKHHNMG